MDFSIIHYYGIQTSKCGYCKGRECSIAHGMHAYKMLPQDYQDLIDRGWRRSGHYCYKPDNKVTCCPCYTIKCDAQEFKLSKSHKKILKRLTRFLRDGKKDKSEEDDAFKANTANADNDMDNADSGGDGGGGGIRDEPQAPNVPIKDIDLDAITASNSKRQATTVSKNADATITTPSATIQIDNNISIDSSGSLIGSKQSSDGLKPPCKKAKQMRLERKQAKLAAKGIDPATILQPRTNNSQEKTLSSYIADASSTDKHKLKIVLVPSNTQNFTEEAFNLYRKYQLIIHNDNPQRLTPASLQRFCYKSPLKLKLVLVKSKHFLNSLRDTYALYQKYQSSIHSDPPTNVQEYLDFLQRSPLQHTKTSDGPLTGYGSFHQQYWLDDKLIAVAVIDILPCCVSSVYFFYDPDYKFLSLGTYGSLREIHFVQELAATVPSLKYYYMGFYIHSCPKMHYKGKLTASYLLCPETFTWNLLNDEIRIKLDQTKYQRLNLDPVAKDVNEFLENHLDLVLLLVDNSTCITYREYIQSFNIETLDNMLDMIRSRIYKEITGEDDDRESILEYGRLVGKPCAHRMLYLNT